MVLIFLVIKRIIGLISLLQSSDSDPNLLPKSFKKLKKFFQSSDDKHRSGGVTPYESSSSLSDELLEPFYDGEFYDNPLDDGSSFGVSST